MRKLKKRTRAAAMILALLLSACGSSAETANSAGSAVTGSAEAVSTAAQAQESVSSEDGQTDAATAASFVSE